MSIQPGKIYGNAQANIKVLVKFVGAKIVTYVHIIDGQPGSIPRRKTIEEFSRCMKEL